MDNSSVEQQEVAAMQPDRQPVLPEKLSIDASAGPGPGSQPASFVITHNVSKKHNIGTIARCCTAFGVKEMCLVGSRQYNSFGSHGADAHVDMRHFPTLTACVEHLKRVEKCEIVGVEITPDALPIQAHPFTGPTAFMLGNEGQGLNSKQMALCDKFVVIPQYGPGTASLNVAVATSIVLHHFALWAGYQERHREGHKYVVADRPQRTRPRGVLADAAEVRAARQGAAAEATLTEAEEHAMSHALSDLLA